MTELIVQNSEGTLVTNDQFSDPASEIPPHCETITELETWIQQIIASDRATMASVRNATVVMNRLLEITVYDPSFIMVDHGHAEDANFALRGLLVLIEVEEGRRKSCEKFRQNQSVLVTTATRLSSENLLS